MTTKTIQARHLDARMSIVVGGEHCPIRPGKRREALKVREIQGVGVPATRVMVIAGPGWEHFTFEGRDDVRVKTEERR